MRNKGCTKSLISALSNTFAENYINESLFGLQCKTSRFSKHSALLNLICLPTCNGHHLYVKANAKSIFTSIS